MDYNRIRRRGFVRSRDNIPIKYADPDKGLTDEQVQLRHACGWGNTPPKPAGRTEQEIIRGHLLTLFNLVFLLLAIVLLLVGSELKNMVFLIVVICNTAIGITQELRAKRAVDQLTLVADQRVSAVREGTLVTLRPELLVRDDIVELSAGDHICADAIADIFLLVGIDGSGCLCIEHAQRNGYDEENDNKVLAAPGPDDLQKGCIQ